MEPLVFQTMTGKTGQGQLFAQADAPLNNRWRDVQEQLSRAERAIAWTDGSCSGNPGPGGWGILLRYCVDGTAETELTLSGGEADTTNNRMELMAALMTLRLLPADCLVEIHTDSQYVQKGMAEWLNKWRRNRWRLASNKPVRNADLWKELDALATGRQVDWRWVRGHSGHPENERADQLARDGLRKAPLS